MQLLNLLNKYKAERFSRIFNNNGYKKTVYSERMLFEIIERERERANRNVHYFSLIVLELDMPSKNDGTTRDFLEKILKRIRMIDEVGWFGPKQIGIILPYTDADGAREFAGSLDDLFESSIPVSLGTIYTYPSDGQPG